MITLIAECSGSGRFRCSGMGVVAAVGSEATGFQLGQRVTMANPLTMRPEGKGTFQQYSAVPFTSLVRHCLQSDAESGVLHRFWAIACCVVQIAVPDSVPDATAAQFLVRA